MSAAPFDSMAIIFHAPRTLTVNPRRTNWLDHTDVTAPGQDGFGSRAWAADHGLKPYGVSKPACG
jgi:hypothetical protein